MTMAKGMISPGNASYDQHKLGAGHIKHLYISQILTLKWYDGTHPFTSDLWESELNTIYLNSGAQKSPGPYG
jgi:hypothetical protein